MFRELARYHDSGKPGTVLTIRNLLYWERHKIIG